MRKATRIQTNRVRSSARDQALFAGRVSRAHTAIFSNGLKPAQVLRMSQSEATSMVDGLGPLGYLALRQAYRSR